MIQWGIYVVDAGTTVGAEQSGMRPAILVKEFDDVSLCLIIPLTGQLEAERFRHTIRINSTKSTKLRNDSIAMLYQMKSVSLNRIGKNEIGALEEYQIKNVMRGIKEMLNLQ